MKKLEYLSSICEEKTTFSFRLMRLSTQKAAFSDFFESIVLLIEYLQLVSQIFLIYLHSGQSFIPTKLGALAQTCAKAFDLTYITDHDWGSLITILTVIIFATLAALRFMLLQYIVYIAFKTDKKTNMLISIWKVVFRLQGRSLFFYLSSFWVGLLLTQETNMSLLSEEVRNLIKGIFWSFFIIDYSLTIVLEKYFTHILPTKGLLSSKTTALRLSTFTQKFLIQIINAFVTSTNIDANPWIYAVIGMAFDILRIYHFLNKIPLYRSKALFLQASLLMVAFSFNISAIIYSILRASDYSMDINFLIIVWILLMIVGIKGIKNYLHRFLTKILTHEKHKFQELLHHKVFLLKEMKDEEISEDDLYHNWKALLAGSLNNDIQSAAKLKEQDTNSLNIFNSKSSINQFCIQFLIDLSIKFPKDQRIKLYKAYFYAKKVKLYPKALRLLSELQKSPNYVIRFNAFLLLDDIQSTLRIMYENSSSRLDIFTYTRSMYEVANLKQDMYKQTQLKLKIYQEMQQSYPNLSFIFDTAQTIHNHRSSIDKNAKVIKDTLPEYYLEPITLYAHYNLMLNHLIPEYLDWMKKLSEKRIKYQKYYDIRNLCQENIYHPDSAFMYVSGRKEDLGKITYISDKAKDMHGHDPVGKPVFSFISPFLQTIWKKYLTHSFETGENLSPNAIGPAFLHNITTGYIVAGSFFLNIHPFIWEGLHFISICRPLSLSKDYILLSENGEIQAFTENIAKKLKLKPSVEPNPSIGRKIEEVCPGLEEVDKAFTLLARLSIEEQKQQEEDPVIQNAKRIYDVYSTGSETVQMRPLMPSSENYLEDNQTDSELHHYHCTISTRFYGDILVKIVMLEGTKQSSIVMEAKKPQKTLDTPGAEPAKQITVLNSPIKPRNELFSEEEAITTKRLNSELKFPRKAFNFETEDLPSTSRHLLSLKQQTEKETSTVQQQNASQRKNSDESLDHDVKPKKVIEVDFDTYSVNSQKSTSSTSLRKMKAFNSALASKYYPRYYLIFVVLLCTALCGVIINQIILTTSMDNYVRSLKIRKDVVSKARVRSLKMMDIHRGLRVLWSFGVGNLLESDIRSVNGRAPAQINRIKQYIGELSAANKDLRTTVDQLDVDIGEIVFRRDVRMYETDFDEPVQNYINLTNFEAADSIISNCLQVVPIATENLTSAVPQMSIMIRNIPNDILLQTENVANVFIASLDRDMENNLSSILTGFCIILVLLIILIIGLNYMLYSQYADEKRYMVAVRALDLDSIRTVQNRLLRFIQLIEEEVSFEGIPSVEISKFFYRRKIERSRVKLRNVENSSDKSLTGIRRKYTIYAIMLSVLIIIVAGLVGLNASMGSDKTKSLNRLTNQLQQMNTVNENLALLASIVAELAAENDMTLIMNKRPSVLFPIALNDLSQGKNLVLDGFDSGSEEETEVLRPLLFENQCAKLTTDIQTFCRNLTKSQKNAGYIYLVTTMESIFTDFKQRFASSNKSSQDLKSFRLEVQTSIIPNTVAVQLIGATLSQAFDNNLEKSIASSDARKTLRVSLITVSLVLSTLLIYRFILIKVRESDNEFRRVLQVFPANVILSNFILKSYMLKAAKGTLDFIKNEL